MVGQLGAVQQSTAAKGGSELAFLTLVLVPGRYPIMLAVTAPFARHPLFLPLRLEMGLATSLVREFCEKISNLHIYSINYQ